MSLPSLEVINTGHLALPKKAHDTDAGFDLRASLGCESFEMLPNDMVTISTGLHINLNSIGLPCFALVTPRSGLGSKGFNLANTVGVIDQGYQGEIMVKAVNRGSEPLLIRDGDRIAQLIIIPILPVDLKSVDDFSDTSSRGEGGFGSTGLA